MNLDGLFSSSSSSSSSIQLFEEEEDLSVHRETQVVPEIHLP
jgi:hypothetical protein